MNLYATEIKAIDSLTREMKVWAGPNVPGISWLDAEEYCQKNGLGYCEVIGVLITEIPTLQNGDPDWSKRIDYDTPSLN